MRSAADGQGRAREAMSEDMEELKREARAVGSAPIMFGAAVVIIAASIWGFMHWSYRAVLSAKDAHIASLQRRLDDYRETLGGAGPEEARRRIGTLESELRTLRLRLTPRHLAPSQRQAIADHSRRPGGVEPRGVTLVVEETCSDCAAFAAEIADALRIADNWAVAVQAVKEPGGRPRLGLGIRVPEPTRPPPEALVLQQALRSAGLPFSMLSGGSGTELLVTERAQP